VGPIAPDLETALLELATLRRGTGRISEALAAASCAHDIFTATYGEAVVHTRQAGWLLGELEQQRSQQ
jgi:hypothetical protein